MNLTRLALLAAVGVILVSAPALTCDYSMKSDLTAEASAAPAPAGVARTTEPTATANITASNSATPVPTEAASAQTAKADVTEPTFRVTN